MGKRLTLALASLAFVAVLIGAYVGGYVSMGKHFYRRTSAFREYPHQWQVIAYEPAAWIEGKLRGTEVRVIWAGDGGQ
jgi:hypothetical protein